MPLVLKDSDVNSKRWLVTSYQFSSFQGKISLLSSPVVDTKKVLFQAPQVVKGEMNCRDITSTFFC